MESHQAEGTEGRSVLAWQSSKTYTTAGWAVILRALPQLHMDHELVHRLSLAGRAMLSTETWTSARAFVHGRHVIFENKSSLLTPGIRNRSPKAPPWDRSFETDPCFVRGYLPVCH